MCKIAYLFWCEQVGASLHLTFTGEAFRIRYVQAINMGTFEIFVNGARLDIIDAMADELRVFVSGYVIKN